jgi:NADH-quinone oxidoreductase subunit F
MEKDPHRLIEGCIIAMYAIGAHKTFIYVRCELVLSIQRLEAAVKEAHAKGYLGARPFGKDHPMDIVVHPGAGAYICGEETSLLNSLEGQRGEPRLKPPFPAVKGAFGMPTIVNNVETIASVPDVVEMGGERWSNLSLLPPEMKDGGTRLYGVSGHVKRPGCLRGARGHHAARAHLRLRRRHAARGPSAQGRDPRWSSSTPVLRPRTRSTRPTRRAR